MEQIYFLAGLGTEQDDVLPLADACERRGLKLVYLDLPGQNSNCKETISSAEELRIWIKRKVPVNSKIVAFSLGADFTAGFLEDLSLSHAVLLDGAILTLEDIDSDLATEVEVAESFIIENNLEMDVATVQNLLRIREEIRREIWHEHTKTQVLMLICDSYPQIFIRKKERLVHSRNMNFQSAIVENSTHQIFVGQPEKVAELITQFFQTS